MTKLVAPTLDSFAGMADDERDVLFETFRVWVENDGSLRTTGELLVCDPNIVCNRLHRKSRYQRGRLAVPAAKPSPNSAWRWKYTAASTQPDSRSQVRFRHHATALDCGAQRFVVAFVLVGIGRGKTRQCLICGAALPEVGRDRNAIHR